MKLFGSLERLVSIVYRKSGFNVTVEPSSASANTSFQLPAAGGGTKTLVDTDSSQTLTGKSMDGDDNTFSDISISSLKTVLADADKVIRRDASGAVISGNSIPNSSALVTTDASQTLTGKTMSGASNTFSNISLTSSVTGVLPVANGGTNSSAALNNNRVMQSSGGAIVEAAAITASRALISDANGIPTHSAVTSTELGYVSGVTSAIQTQINGKQSTSEKGQPNGYASLDGAGKVPVSQLPNSIMEYQGMWNASTNSPTLADGVGNTGDVYRVSVAGSQDLGSGSISFSVGDYAIYNGSTWEKADTTDAVSSVFGRTGAVTAQSGDYTTSQVTEGSNLYFTDARARTAAVADSISDGITNIAPSQNAVFDALALKADKSTAINTAANSGLSGGGDLSASRSLVIDPSNATAIVGALAGTEEVLVDDGALKKVTTQQIANLAAGTSAQSFTWTDGSATKAITHGYTRAVLVEIYDENFQTVLIDSVVRDTATTLALTRSEASVGGNWTVIVRN